MNDTKSKISEWIGDDDFTISSMTDAQADELLAWLENECIDIEQDMDKVAEKLTEMGL